MANPVLNERAFQKASTAWAPPEPDTEYFPPVDDGPVADLGIETAPLGGGRQHMVDHGPHQRIGG